MLLCVYNKKRNLDFFFILKFRRVKKTRDIHLNVATENAQFIINVLEILHDMLIML